jgi:uncharacterized OsmC-like protein
MTAQAAVSEKPARPIPPPRNGVDTEALFATLNVVDQNRELADFEFRATNQWVRGTHSRSFIHGFSGAGGEQEHNKEFSYDTDHPAVLCGADNGPTPVELVLAGLAGCITAGIGNIAAARGVTLEEVECTVEGDINLLGLLGLDKQVRNGYEGIRVSYKIRGDASPETLRKIVEQSRNRSAVFDVISNPVPVELVIDAG